jgi:hypothetical protein
MIDGIVKNPDAQVALHPSGKMGTETLFSLRALPEPAPAKAGGPFYQAVPNGTLFDFLRAHHD